MFFVGCHAIALTFSRVTMNLLLTKPDSLLSDGTSLRQEICICKSAFGIRMHAAVTRFSSFVRRCSLARSGTVTLASLLFFVGGYDLRRDGVLLFS
jgi:hypothetical protein